VDEQVTHGVRLLETDSPADTPLERHVVLTARDAPSHELTLLGAVEATCTHLERRREARVTDVTRTTSSAAVTVLTLLGLGVGGFGGWATLDGLAVLPSSTRVLSEQLGPTPTTALGVGASVGGLALLATALVNGLRALDSHTEDAPAWVSTSEPVPCGSEPARGMDVRAALPSGGRVLLGALGQDGALHLSPDALATKVPSLDAPRLGLVVGDAATTVDVSAAQALATQRRAEAAALERRAAEREQKLAAARGALDDRRVETARVFLDDAAALGADTSSLRERADAVERDQATAEAERKRRYAEQWGPFSTWRTRPGNRELVAALAQAAKSAQRRAKMDALYTQEKQRNDDVERPDDIVSTPWFPETSGNFTYLKALDEQAGEALFSASDGLFVLRLSPGDSFRAYPGQSVYLTMHARGERMSMTSGRRLPVFLSGSSPARVRRVPGVHPNRARERALRKRLDADLAEAVGLLRRQVTGGDEHEGPARKVTGATLSWSDEAAARLDVVDADGTRVYCVEVGLSCAEPAGETVTLEQLLEGR
jgi:hypothetical protein